MAETRVSRLFSERQGIEVSITEEQVKKALAGGRDLYVRRLLDSLQEVEEERADRRDKTSLIGGELRYTAVCALAADELSVWRDHYLADVVTAVRGLVSGDERNSDLADLDKLTKYLMSCAFDMVQRRLGYLEANTPEPWSEVRRCIEDREKFVWKLGIEEGN